MSNVFYQHSIYVDISPVGVNTDPTATPDSGDYTAFFTRWDEDTEELVVVVQRIRLEEIVLRGENAEAFLADRLGNVEELFERPAAVKPAA
jgi:hypothetical protein